MKLARRLLALILIASLCAGTISMTAFAADTVEVESLPGGRTETIDVEITIDGNKTTAKAENAVTESGTVVDYISETFDNVISGITGKSEWSASKGSFSAWGGSETTKEQVAPNVTVDVPLTENESNTEYGPTAGTSSTTGSAKENNSASYDQTTTTVEKQGSVTVETTEITYSEEFSGSELDHVVSEVVPNKDNDLIRDNTSNTGAVIPVDSENTPQAAAGYEYVYIGSGNSSQFWVAYLNTQPSSENEKPVYTYTDENGETVNLYKGNKNNTVDELFIEGKEVDLESDVKVSRGGTFQFVMYNPTTGEISTTYCADLTTGATKGYSYNIENLEDSDYYGEEEAAMIRAVANNGYWGTEEGKGSLAAVKAMMREAKDDEGKSIFTEAEINSLTDGMALSATQFAIWTFSNEMKGNVKIINTMYSTADDNYVLNGYWKDVEAKDKDNNDNYLYEEDLGKREVIFKLYEYLINLDPDTIDEEEQTTANTIINEQNFLKSMELSILEKAEGHANNADADTNNDAYVTNLTFALVVTPSTGNGDDLVVSVVDTKGNTIASGRIAGDPEDGENIPLLEADENGNYTFSDIVMVEGDQQFNISLAGVQNLAEGVYLYTSEVRGSKESQTMVGVAGGERNVNVSMSIEFNVNVNDEVIVTERVWRNERNVPDNDPPEDPPEDDPPGDPPADPPADPPENDPLEEIPDEPIPLADIPEDDTTVEIPDGDIPLADVPQTGDMSIIWFGISALSGLGLAGIKLFGKKKDDEE